MTTAEMKKKLNSVISNYPLSYKVQIDTTVDENETEYIEIYNNHTEECLCWFFRDNDFYQLNIPRIIGVVTIDDVDLMQDIIKLYYTEVEKYQ